MGGRIRRQWPAPAGTPRSPGLLGLGSGPRRPGLGLRPWSQRVHDGPGPWDLGSMRTSPGSRAFCAGSRARPLEPFLETPGPHGGPWNPYQTLVDKCHSPTPKPIGKRLGVSAWGESRGPPPEAHRFLRPFGCAVVVRGGKGAAPPPEVHWGMALTPNPTYSKSLGSGFPEAPDPGPGVP